MVKPINFEEMLLLIGALLRRAWIRNSKSLSIGHFTMNAETMTLTANVTEIPVTVREFNILFKLLPYPGKVFSCVQLVEEFGSIEILKNDFVSDVFHEIKKPLSVIQNYITFLQNPHLTAERHKEYTDAISSASEQLTLLVSNILRLSKLDN